VTFALRVLLDRIGQSKFDFENLRTSNPRTGSSIEVFYADRALETFGRFGAGWFWWSRRSGFAPDNLATGPFATSYAAYRHAMNTASLDDAGHLFGDPQR
jgi:hypothetical protein